MIPSPFFPLDFDIGKRASPQKNEHVLPTSKIVNSYQEDQRPTKAGFLKGAESFQLPIQALGNQERILHDFRLRVERNETKNASGIHPQGV